MQCAMMQLPILCRLSVTIAIATNAAPSAASTVTDITISTFLLLLLSQSAPFLPLVYECSNNSTITAACVVSATFSTLTRPSSTNTNTTTCSDFTISKILS